MADVKKPIGAKPIVDIARPGKTAPSETSKPVLVPNRAILKDPMVNTADDPPEAVPDKETPGIVKASKPDLKPAMRPAEDKPATDGQDPKSAAADEAKTPPAKGTDGDNDDDEPSAAEQTEQQLAAEADAEAKHDAEIQKLVESKQYFLPINAVEQRRSKRVVILGIVLSVLLALAWADIALDAGIIQVNGVKPVTHFFSN